MNEQCLGDASIRVVEDGATRFLANATVFPEDFLLQVASNSNAGSIRLNCVTANAVHVIRDDNFTADCTRDGDNWDINVSVTGKRPATIQAKIDFESEGVAEVCFVCPTEVCAIVDASGEEIDSDRAIPLDRLDGLRLQIVDPRDRAGFIYSLEEMLLVEQIRPTGIKGVSQLPLSLIQNAAKELLGKSNNNDVRIQFGLFFRGDIKAHFKFSVKRYSRELKLQREHPLADQNVVQVALDQLQGNSNSVENELVVAPFTDPLSDSYRNAVNNDGQLRWNIDTNKLLPGGYLLHVQNRGRETILPLLITVRRNEIPQIEFESVPLEEQFAAVSNMTDHVKRPKAWDRLVDMMVANPLHPAWVTINALITSTQEMPITTFESIVALTRHPAAIARVGMENPGKARWWERFEELPFLWSLVPIGTWIQTAKQVIAAGRASLANAGVSQPIIDQNVQARIDDFAKNAPLRCPSLSCVVALMKYGTGFPIDDKAAGNCMACAEIKDLENERRNMVASLERIDGHVRWPDLRLEVSDFVQEKLDEIERLQTTEMMQHQLPVWNAPVVAAVHSVYDIPVASEQLAVFRTLRSFNLPWYENANRIAVHLLAARRFASDFEWSDSLRSM